MDSCVIQLSRKDNRTSTGVGVPHRHAAFDYYKHVKRPVPKHLLESNPILREDLGQTTTGAVHDYKYYISDYEPGRKAKNCQSFHFQKSLTEKLRRSNFMPIPPGRTEYNQKFVQKAALPSVAKVLPPEPHAMCKSQGLGRDEQKPVSLNLSSVSKHLDPYLSTSHLVHRPFTLEDHHNPVNAHNIITFYDVKGEGPEISVRREPIYDEVTFKTKSSLRLLPKVTCAVPNKGMQTEMQAKYRLPQDNLSTHLWDSGVEYLEVIPQASPWENRAPPNMYSTEYFHIGTGWPVRAAVDPGWPSKATVDPGVRP